LKKRVERGRDTIVADARDDRVERKRVEKGHNVLLAMGISAPFSIFQLFQSSKL
jgi:hypothetical protein